jgi:hypothetical protein
MTSLLGNPTRDYRPRMGNPVGASSGPDRMNGMDERSNGDFLCVASS